MSRSRSQLFSVKAGCIFWACMTACSQGPRPCLALRHCDEGYECLASRCVVRGAEPVPSGTERLVLHATRLGVLGEANGAGFDSVALYAPGSPPRELLLAFELPEERGVGAAFLHLASARGTPASTGELEVEVTRLMDPWTPRSLELGAIPQRGLQRSRGVIPDGGRGRIDVTALVSAWQREPERAFGLAVQSERPSRIPLRLRGDSDGPWLELYLYESGAPF